MGSLLPRPSAHKQKGKIPDWRLSWLETFRDVFSVYSCSVLTWAINICRTCFSWQKLGMEGIDLKVQSMSRTAELYQNAFPKKFYQKNKNEASSGVSISLPFNPLRMRSALNSSWRGFTFKAKSNSGLGNHKSHNSLGLKLGVKSSFSLELNKV